jgi:hypothetical protein
MQFTQRFLPSAKRAAAIAACGALFLCGSSSLFAQQQDTPPAPPSQQQQQDQQAPPSQPDPSGMAPQQSAPPATAAQAPQDQQQNAQPDQQQDQQPMDPNAGPQVQAPPPSDRPAPPPAPRRYSNASRALPDPLTIPAGTVVQIRTSDWISSDKNKKGDQFIGTLVNPVIVDGWVVARRGQTIVGQVTDAQRAGRVKGVSKLQLDLNQLTLVDGQMLNVQTSLLNASAGTSNGRDAVAVGTTTGTGAAIGGIAAGGAGAGIGAGAGFVAGIAGVLLTRGKPTIIPPEDVLTFRLETPASFTTIHGQLAFRPATPQDYADNSQPPRPRLVARPYPGPYAYPYGPAFGYYPPPVAIGFGYGYGYPGYYRRGWGWGW